ncbi:MAG: retropepsin-like aspartic protease [bacterium]|nr:retropepsin-like aspartic protease [bacterium]
MSNGYVFPYGITLSEGGKITTFPVAEVGFTTREGERITLFLLIDSGATISALPKTDAEALGIVAENGVPVLIVGIDGKSIQGWRHEISTTLQNEQYNLPFVFLNNEEAPRILGREGTFDRFTVIFQEDRQRSALVKTQAEESSAIGKTIDTLASQ